MKIDALDKEILNIIQEKNSCTPKVSLISKKTGKPTTTIYERLKKLEKTGAIKTYSAILDPVKIGKPVTAYMFATMKLGEDASAIAERLSKIKGVQEVCFTTGEWDFIIKVKLSDMDEYYKFSTESILKDTPGLLRANGRIIPRVYVETPRIEIE